MKKKAFIFRGGWEGHEPQEFARWAQETLQESGFEVQCGDSLEPLADSGFLSSFDLIVPIWTMGDLTDEQERGLTGAVRSGSGLAGWHGGMGDAFRSRTAYQFMVGGQFVAHPGDILEYRVEIDRREDPLVEGLRDFSITSEQYYMHVDPSNEVLASTVFRSATHPWIDGVRMPVVWKRSWGQGRVFYSSLGHVRSDFDVPEVATLTRRGLLWASR